MDIEAIRQYCLAKKGVTEEFPFDEQTLVFKVMGKIFLLTDIYGEVINVNLKCDPEYAIELREQYNSVRPGYHMNKKYWNTVTYNGEFSKEKFYELIEHSYRQVVQKLPKKLQQDLQSL